MTRFYPLQIANITRETPDCVSIVLDVPVHLHNDFRYKAGQYVTFRLKINGEELRRSYSLCSSPVTDSEWRVAIKKVQGGRGSVFLNDQVKPGDVLEVMAPEGNFTSSFAPERKNHYVLFAGGSGITPVLSILKTVLATESQSEVTLFYGNRDKESIIFHKQLEKIQAENNTRLKIIHVLEKSGNESGFIEGMLNTANTSSLINKFITRPDACEYFICGPGPMMECIKEALKTAGVAEKKVHIEYFSSGAQSSKNKEKTFKNAEITIICDGDEVHTVLQDNESVLEAALRNNLDAPYACQGGSCCTCRAKLIEGQVEMKVNYALLESEVKEGFILTCQSYAISDKLIVDYDRGR
jgi:ring-1,2-phenylacetyl-CoA epoxidase subunit PaaE